MSIEFRVAGSAFSWAPYAPRIADGLVICSIFGDTMADSVRNFAPGAAPLEVVGSPTIEANYARCVGTTNFFETGVADSEEATVIAVARQITDGSTNALSPIVIGNYNSAAGLKGQSLYFNDSGGSNAVKFISHVTTGGVETGIASAVLADVSSFRLVGGYFGGGLNGVFDATGGGPDDQDATADSRDLGATMRIGSGYTTFLGTCDVAMVWKFSRRLTATERAIVVSDTRALMAARSITV